MPHWLTRRLTALVLGWGEAPMLSGGTLYFSDSSGVLKVVEAVNEDGDYLYVATKP